MRVSEDPAALVLWDLVVTSPFDAACSSTRSLSSSPFGSLKLLIPTLDSKFDRMLCKVLCLTRKVGDS